MVRHIGRAPHPRLGQGLGLLGPFLDEITVEGHRAAELLCVIVGQLASRPVEDGEQRRRIRTHDGVHLSLCQGGSQGVRIDCAPGDVTAVRIDVDAGLGQSDREVGEG